MKKLFIAMIAIASMPAFAQDEVRITIKLKDLPNDSTVLLAPYKTEYEGEQLKSIVKNNQVTFLRKLNEGRGSVQMLMVAGYGGTVLYLEPGEILITDGDKPGLDNAKITGSKFAEDWNIVRENYFPNSPKLKQLNELKEIQKKAVAVGDEEASVDAASKIDKFEEQRKQDMLEWIRKNPNSGVSAYLLTQIYHKSGEMSEKMKEMLGPNAQKTWMVQRFLDRKRFAPQMPKNPNLITDVLDGDIAPAFESMDENGKKVALSDFKGKYVFIDFWASWCGPCKPQMPFLKAAYEKFKNKNFVMLGVSLDEKKEAWLNGVKEHDLKWLQLSSLKGWKEPVIETYKIRGVPFNVLVGPDGKILATGLYNEDIDKKLSELIK